MSDLLSFYQTHSPITDPGEYGYLYDDLPEDVRELFEVINGVLLHYWAADRMKLPLSRAQRSEQRLRTMRERLGQLTKMDNAPLTVRRELKEMQIARCRSFAVFLVSILRHRGIPARMRVGFEDYFEGTDFYGDHWIAEYWDEGLGRWRLADPDIGSGDRDMLQAAVRRRLKPGLDFTDLRHEVEFHTAGPVWQMARAGEIKVDLYRAHKTWKGWPCIRGNLLHEFQALNGLEMGLYDYWDELHRKPEGEMTAADREALDEVAALSIDPDENFGELRTLFEEMPRTSIIRSKLRMLGLAGEGTGETARGLQDSDMARLRMMAGEEPALAGENGLEEQIEAQDAPRLVDQALLDKGETGIVVQGARQNNLKDIDVYIPRNELVVITGVSGSGKSSLAFDTIYAEGQRRYVESLSSLARQFTRQLEKPDVDKVIGLNPAIAIEQRTIAPNSRSTVGSITDVLNYLRVLFARVGRMHCPQCGRDVTSHSAQEMASRLAGLPEGTEVQVLAPVNRFKNVPLPKVLEKARAGGFEQGRVDGVWVDLGEKAQDKAVDHDVEVLAAVLAAPEGGENGELSAFFKEALAALERALKVGLGVVVLLVEGEELRLNNDRVCPHCEIHLPKLEPQLLNQNTVYGMCHACDGLGVTLEVDPERIIDQPEKSLMEDASAFYHYRNLRNSSSSWWKGQIKAIADHFGADLETPWKDLPEDFRRALIYGTDGENVKMDFVSEDRGISVSTERPLSGAIHHINRLYRQTKSENMRRYYHRFMQKNPCPECEGEKLSKEARFVTLGNTRYPEVTDKSIGELLAWIQALRPTMDKSQMQIGEELLDEIEQRLKFICDVGLHYLTLDRPAPTLSGGEAQRIRLAGQIGSELMGVVYVLDEPSIGLHSRDQGALLDLLGHLRDAGNTVLVVEHDKDAMLAADWIIDIGPGAGVLGGEIVAEGKPEEVMAVPESLTGQYLAGELAVQAPNEAQRRAPTGWLTVEGASLHNLKQVEACFPLETLICVTGVSGSGKSSLVTQTLYPALAQALRNEQTAPGPHLDLLGVEALDDVIHITQAPIGRNPRSNPGTYVKVLNEVRKVFAKTEMARTLGFSAGTFSFNSKEGRCEACEGYGAKRVKMHFIADVWATCQECGGKRFIPQVLEVQYKGAGIADVMEMDVQEAYTFFEGHEKIQRILGTLLDVGLGYLRLGQNSMTLSGGEAQRIKLAKELSRPTGRRTLYILDEPTTGLHFVDIQKLLDILHRLVDEGNTVIVIEHNLDVVKTADWIMDLGPEGGDEGGWITAEGTPEEVAAVEASYTGQALKQVLGEVVRG